MIIAICMQSSDSCEEASSCNSSLLNLFTEIYFLRYRILAILRFSLCSFLQDFVRCGCASIIKIRILPLTSFETASSYYPLS